MDYNFYGITEDQLESFADLEYGLRYNRDNFVSDGLKHLASFGGDVREIERSVRALLQQHVPLRERYREIYVERSEIFDSAAKASVEEWSNLLGMSPEVLLKREALARTRVGLGRELGLETAHLDDFGKKLDLYLFDKARANYKEGILLRGEPFKEEPEYEDYVRMSHTSQRLYDVLLQSMPGLEQVAGHMPGDEEILE